MRALLLSHSNVGGGAGRAAERLRAALADAGVDVRMHVDFRSEDAEDVMRNKGPLVDAMRRLRISAEEIPAYVTGHAQPRLYSPGMTSAIRARRINASSADVVNLHWTGMGYLSIESIGRIAKPLVWTLHDMWAFTGGLGYDDESADAAWRSGFATASRLDIERWVMRRKQRAWKRPIHLVAPSRWLANLAAASPLTDGWPMQVIPNPLDVDLFRPVDPVHARHSFGIAPDARVVAVVLSGNPSDPRKGLDLLADALSTAALDAPDVEIVVIGADQPPAWWTVPLRTHWLGRLDGERLVQAYNTADVVVVPSRQDNLPQTGTEAAACGRPIVAFAVGGLPDIVQEGISGRLVRGFDTPAMAAAVIEILDDTVLKSRMSKAAREHAVASWSPSIVAAQYVNAFDTAIGRG